MMMVMMTTHSMQPVKSTLFIFQHHTMSLAGMTSSARAAAAALIVQHERALLDPLCVLLDTANEASTAAACEAAWAARL